MAGDAAIAGVRRCKGIRTTRRDDGARPAPDLVERSFSADQPNHVWVADITDIPTWAGFLYLAVVLDAFSRRIVGRWMAAHRPTALVLDAFDMALGRRRPEYVIPHSDQGSQDTSIALGTRCRPAGVRPSLGSVGDCYDTALCESPFATLERELIDRTRFRSHATGQLQAVQCGLDNVLPKRALAFGATRIHRILQILMAYTIHSSI